MIDVRGERESDGASIFEIEAAAFERRNEANLVEALRRSADPYLALVAEERGRIVGHIVFSPVEIESSSAMPRVAGLAPVAVAPAHQGRGIGSALVRAGLERCREVGWRAVFLIGAPAYYGRFGFLLAAPGGFTYGDPLVDSVLQALELEPGALSGCSGRVCFHPAFAETGCG